MIGQHNKGRQVFVQCSQSVADPGSHSGKPWPLKSCRLQVRRLAVNSGLANHVVHESDIVHALPQRSHNIAQHFATVAVRFKPER